MLGFTASQADSCQGRTTAAVSKQTLFSNPRGLHVEFQCSSVRRLLDQKSTVYFLDKLRVLVHLPLNIKQNILDPTIIFDGRLSSVYYHVTCTLIDQLFGFCFVFCT